MAINIADSFNRTTAQPPFAGVVFADLTARDAYANTLRYEGMECYVVAEGLYYSLVGGVANGNWIERAGGSGSGVVAVADLTARNAIPELERTNGMLVQVISEDTIYKLIGLPLGATTTDANWDAVITSKASQVITAKDIDGGTASNTSRVTVPKGTASDLHALARKEATVLENTESKQLMLDDGTNLNAIPKFGNTDTMFVDIAANEVLAGWTQTFTGSTATLTRSTSTDVAPYAYRLANVLSDNLGTLKLTRLVDVPKGFNGQRLNISFDYASTILDGFGLSIYDMTNSGYIIGYDNSDAYKIPAANIPTKANYVFDLPLTCTQIRIELHKKLGFDLVGGVFSFNNVRIGKWSPNVAITEGPKSHVRLNNGGNRGATNTNVVYYTNITQQSGTGIAVVNTSALGTEVHIKRSGVVTVTATRNQPVSTSGSQIVKNQTTYNISHPAEDILAGYTGSSGAGVALQFSGQARVVAGDIIRVVSENNTGASNNNNTLSVVLHEDNLAARFADYTLNQDVSFQGYVSATQSLTANTTNINLTSLKDTTGAWTGSTFVVPSAGDYELEGILNFSASVTTWIDIYVNGTLRMNGGFVNNATRGMLSAKILNLVAGDIISFRSSVAVTAAISTTSHLSIRKVATSQQVFTPIAMRYPVRTGTTSGVKWTVYNDGWVEQQGRVASNGTSVVFNIAMLDTDYYPAMTFIDAPNAAQNANTYSANTLTTSGWTVTAVAAVRAWRVADFGNSAAVKALGANPSY